jgi:hypothetical protein
MSTDQGKCESLVGMLAYVEDQDVYAYETTIYDNQTAILVAKTTDGTTKKVNLRLPGLTEALRLHAQYGFGHPLERNGVQWEFRQGRFRCLFRESSLTASGFPMGSHFSSSSSDSTDN